MEVVGVVAATAQLGATVFSVCEAYSQIKGIGEFLHDLDSQLDATRMILAVLKEAIGKSEFDASTEGWWRQSEIERLLRSCNQHYQRMNDIFTKISHRRSSASALRAWIRTKQYDSDISHLRLCINTCTDALQLPVIMYQIHTRMKANPESSIPGVGSLALEEIASRLARLESSMEDTRNDLEKRSIDQDPQNPGPTAQSTSIDELMESLELDLSKLTSLQQREASSSKRRETKTRLSQMQNTISKLRIEVHREGNPLDTSLSLQEIREKADLEKDSRSTLELADEFVGSTMGYASTIGCLSTVSLVTSQPCTAPIDDARVLRSPNGESSSPVRQLLVLGHPKDKPENATEWAHHRNQDDRDSVISKSVRFQSPPSETIATSTSKTSGIAITGDSSRREIIQRLIRTVERSVRYKNYGLAIDRLEILLSRDRKLLDDQEKDRLSQLMVKSIIKGNRKIEQYMHFVVE